MIVIGVDVHKHSLTAVAVDELGRTIAERDGPVGEEVVRGRDRWRRSGCGRSRTAGTSRAGWSGRWSRRASGWCGCRRV